jgi:4-hydroxy-4-methyl-2-oxoglutarate aldolase
MPVRVADVHGPQAKPFGRMTEALDSLQPGEIYLATGGSTNCAAWARS